ncbi:MAG: hypothetical protein Q6365_015335, partial [Candidatus Sigynarchaeota archaeon]
EALFEVFRLKLNMSAPCSGPNKHWSPLERAGVNSSYQTWIEALFPLPGSRDRDSSWIVAGVPGQEALPVPSEADFRENLERYKQLFRNPADQRGRRVKTKHEKIKRR